MINFPTDISGIPSGFPPIPSNIQDAAHLIPEYAKRLPKKKILSRERKVHAAQALKSACENYKVLSPFNQKKSLLDWPVEAFKKFIHWIKREKPFPISDLKLQFAMHLFRNYDKAILDKPDLMAGDKLSMDLPFSFVLGSWRHLLN